MADIPAKNFGQMGSKEYSTIKTTIGGTPLATSTAGTFAVNNLPGVPKFSAEMRLVGTGGAPRMSVDGIRRGPEMREKALFKDEVVRLGVQIEFLIQKANELLAQRLALENNAGKEELQASFGVIIDELREMEKTLLLPTLNQKTLDTIKEALKEREGDVAKNTEAHELALQSLVDTANESAERLDIANALLEKATFVANLRGRYEKLSGDISTLKNSPFSVTGKDQLLHEYESYSFITSGEDLPVEDVATVNNRINDLENLTKEATQELVTLQEKDTTERSSLERRTGKYVASFLTKKRETLLLLQDPSTLSKKTETETLIKETELLETAIEEGSVTDDLLKEFNTHLTLLDDKISELTALSAADKKSKEGLLSSHAEWPRNIKYEDAKKATMRGGPSVSGGWKKDGVILPKQNLWGNAALLGKKVFEKYNQLIDKALSVNMRSGVQDLIAKKEAILLALNNQKVEEALQELNILEQEVGIKRETVDNEIEKADLQTKFSAVTEAFSRLSTVPALDKAIFDTKKKDLEQIFTQLIESETEPNKTKSLLLICKSLLVDLSSYVEERNKDSKKEASERLGEFRALTKKLEDLTTAIDTKTKAALSEEQKVLLRNEAARIEKEGAIFIENETSKKHKEAEEVLRLFATELTELSEKIKKAETESITAKESVESFMKESKAVISFFEELKAEIGSLTLSDGNRDAFNKRMQGVTTIVTSLNDETDLAKRKNILALLVATLCELSAFVMHEMGDPDSLRQKIASLRSNIATITGGEKAAQENKLEDLVATLKSIESIETKLRSINGGKVARIGFSREITKGTQITLREKDPLTGESKTMRAKSWQNLQNSKKDLQKIEKEERQEEAERELRVIHEGMWARDKKGYKRLYAGRIWTTKDSDKMTKRVVQGILNEKIDTVDKELKGLESEISRRDDLRNEFYTTRAAVDLLHHMSDTGRPIDEEELAREQATFDSILRELEELDAKITPLTNEKRSLSELSEEDVARAAHEEATKKGELRNQRLTYSPADDAGMDHLPVQGITGEDQRKKGLFALIFGKRSSQQKRYENALKSKAIESALSRKDAITGFTKTAINTSPLVGKAVEPIQKDDLKDTDAELAKIVFPQETKIGSNESLPSSGGMARSVMARDLTEKRNLSATQAIEGNDEVGQGNWGDGRTTEENEGLSTQERQEQRIAKVNSIMGTISKFAKDWRTWVMVGAFATGAITTNMVLSGKKGPQSIASLEETLSWKDFIRDLPEEQQASLTTFIKKLTTST